LRHEHAGLSAGGSEFAEGGAGFVAPS